jgi:outer membrane receptor protein involved in Fe transport
MRFDTNKISAAVRLALTLAATAAASAPAHAQDAAGDKGQALDTIVVTGSNIRRVDIETSNPVVTIDRAAIQQSGKLTLGDLLQNLPAVTGGNTNPQVNNGGGGGSSSIGLRGLGAARTLVLVNGQRIIGNGPGGAADPNSIPVNMVERIEVLTDGASSVYGSDAIAGVVNVILRSNYQGAEFQADYGISDHDDGERKGYHFVFGQSSDKGSIMGGIDYNHQEQILAGNRKFGKAAVDITGSASTPPYTFTGGSSNAAPGRITLPATLKSVFGCSQVAINPGANGQTVDKSNYHCFTAADLFNYAPINLVLTPQERSSAFINGQYHLTDNVDLYLDTWHNKTTSNFQLAPAIISTAGGLVISPDSYYNPFHALFAPRVGLDFRLRASAAGPRTTHNSTVTDQIHTGFKGNFSIFDQSWNWDAGFGYGHFSINTITMGLPNLNIINPDMGPSFFDAASGTVVCGTPSAPILSGCTPFNIFALNNGDPGALAAITSVAVPAISQTFSQEKYEHFDASGGLFNLPAGTVQLAAGASHRTEYVHGYVDPLLTIDPATGNCTLGSQCSSPLQGGFSVKEYYAEAFFPVFKDMPFVKALNITLGDRYSKYSTFGSTNNWKAALEYRPIDDLLLRATVSKIFRAPTVGNVFASPVSSAPAITSDPCDFIAPTPSAPNPNASNPACKGVPATGTFQNVDVLNRTQISAIVSGSNYAGFPLGPEFGKSFDWGFVYDPSWVPGLSFSVDVWRLYLLDTIVALGAQNALNLCFGGSTAYCPLITRNQSGGSQGQLATLLLPTVNLGRSDVQGLDIGFKYRLPQFSFGQFSLVANATYMKQYNVDTAPGTPGDVATHMAGHVIPFDSAALSACPGNTGVCTIPRWKAQTAINWSLGPWDASLRTRYIGGVRLGNPDLAQGQTAVAGIPGAFIDYGAWVYNDISLGYNIEPLNTRIDLGVDNVTNKQPPQFYYDSNTLNLGTDPSLYDLVGRFYFARVTVKF